MCLWLVRLVCGYVCVPVSHADVSIDVSRAVHRSIGSSKALAYAMMRLHSLYSFHKVVPLPVDVFSTKVRGEVKEQHLTALIFSILFQTVAASEENTLA